MCLVGCACIHKDLSLAKMLRALLLCVHVRAARGQCVTWRGVACAHQLCF
jgi:hypothetical protein